MAFEQRAYIPLTKLRSRWLLSAAAVFYVCSFFYHYLDYLAHDIPVAAQKVMLEEGSGVLGGMLLFPLCYWVATRYPLLSPSWWRYLPVHLLTMCAASFADTTIMAGMRRTLSPLLGLGRYDYGHMPVRYLMEFSDQVIVYWVCISLIYLFHEIRFSREREVREARLQAQLSETRLENLRLQLEPHFLFNSLNAISAALYENPRVADEMIGRLSRLLRQVLANEGSHQVPLRREIEMASLYVQMMEARFEERLRVRMEIDPAAEDLLVPQLILQPLIENAIRHGMDPSTFEVDVIVSARLMDDRMELTVCDSGPGLRTGDVPASGIGLRNTRERLQQIYGGSATLNVENRAGRGAMIRIELPLEVRTEPQHAEV